jgi:dTMP kinase
MKAQNYFITLEGVEGVGKSTIAQFIQSFLLNRDIPFLMTREPGGTELAEAIRNIVLKPREEILIPETELMLMFAARLQHVEHKIKPALARGEWVICDRFVDSSYAYQGAGRGIDLHKIAEIQNWTLGDFVPDVTIILDAPVQVGFKRMLARKEKDRIEQEGLEFFERVRQGFLHLAKTSPRYRIVNAAKTPEEVQNEVADILESLC